MSGTSRNFVFNSELIGAYSLATDKVCFVCKGVGEKTKRVFEEALEVEVKEITISDSCLIGIFLVTNEKIALVPWSTTKKEIDELKSYFQEVAVLDIKFNALGNLISANTKGALIHVDLPDDTVELIKDLLKVKKVTKLPSKNRILASFLFVNEKAFLASPLFNKEVIELFKEVFETEGDFGTVNRGSYVIKLGMVANSKGAVVGGLTTGPEIAKIEQIFGIGLALKDTKL